MEYRIDEKEGFKMSKPYEVERYKSKRLFEVFVNSISAYEIEDLTKLRETLEKVEKLPPEQKETLLKAVLPILDAETEKEYEKNTFLSCEREGHHFESIERHPGGWHRICEKCNVVQESEYGPDIKEFEKYITKSYILEYTPKKK